VLNDRRQNENFDAHLKSVKSLKQIDSEISQLPKNKKLTAAKKELKNHLKKIINCIKTGDNLKSNLFNTLEEDINNSFSEKQLGTYFKEIQQHLETEQQETVTSYKRIKESALYLLGLINTILNISKIEAGKLETVKNDAIIQKLIESVMLEAQTYLMAQGKDKAISLIKKSSSNLPKTWFLDRQKTKQVLLNFLSNAVKFTEAGKVSLNVSIKHKKLFFMVSDEGQGIPKAEKNIIFTEFGRTRQSKDQEGTGLGLALSKRLIETQGGNIGFNSTNKGSNFWFELPAK